MSPFVQRGDIIKMKCLSDLFAYFTVTSNDIPHRFMSGTIFKTDKSKTSLPNLKVLKTRYTLRTV